MAVSGHNAGAHTHIHCVATRQHMSVLSRNGGIMRPVVATAVVSVSCELSERELQEVEEMRTRSALWIALIVVFSAEAGFAARTRFSGSVKKHPAFTITSRTTYINPDGSESVAHETRYVSSSGNFRTIQTGENGRMREYFFERGRGQFSVKHDDKLLIQNKLVSPNAVDTAPLPTAEQLLSHPQFLRTETLMGYTAYVLRVMDEETGLPSTDIYRTVELGRTPLKVINYSGGNVQAITEPVSITLGEPDVALLKGPNYPMAAK